MVIVHYWDRFVPWVELPVQRRLYPIFMSGVGSPDIHEYSGVDELSTDPRVLGRHTLPSLRAHYALSQAWPGRVAASTIAPLCACVMIQSTVS